MTKTSLQPAWYLSVAGIAASLGMKAATLSQAIWRNPGHPVPPRDAELEPGPGKGHKGWHDHSPSPENFG